MVNMPHTALYIIIMAIHPLVSTMSLWRIILTMTILMMRKWILTLLGRIMGVTLNFSPLVFKATSIPIALPADALSVPIVSHTCAISVPDVFFAGITSAPTLLWRRIFFWMI
ncbi:hypothetical protein NC652_034122 [Populus alba x Populus x berolinensis]|nr:hypothetical protein NC652_034122 [Populus alba x Populus x berolinensis]